MAFLREGFSRISSGVNDSNVVMYAYDTDDAIATVTASGYFNDATEIGGSDVILVTASDAARFLLTTVSGSTVTTTVMDGVTAGSITTDELATAAVTPAKATLGAMSSFTAVHTTTGGSSTETVTAAGVTVGAAVFAFMNTQGATPITILQASCTTAGQITVACSGDPSTDHKFNIIAFNLS